MNDLYDRSFLVEENGKLRRKRDISDMVCDFCLQKLGESCWTYPCGEMELPLVGDPTGLPAKSDDSWAACLECHPFVQDKNWGLLAARTFLSQIKLAGMEPEVDEMNQLFDTIKPELVAHFERFEAARTGEPYMEHAPYQEHT